MAITFDGTPISCGDHHTFLAAISGGDLITHRTHFWGLKGTSEIVSSTGPWHVQARCWLTDATWTGNAAGYALLKTYLRELRDLRGKHGVLKSTMSDGTLENQWSSATFEGFEAVAFDGHREAGPILDSVGMVNSNNGWIFQGVLRWTVLVDKD